MAISFLKLSPFLPLHHPPHPLLPLHPSSSLFPCPKKVKPRSLRKSYHLHPSHASTKDDTSLTSLDLSDLQEDPIKACVDYTEELKNRWREIHGSKNWSGLLDPMDPLLRLELIRYGEFAAASYQSFDSDPYSIYCGKSKYPRSTFFSSLDMGCCGYEVSRFLHATFNINFPNFFIRSFADKRIWSEVANFIGYIAVSSDATTAQLGRRDIIIAWRGTNTEPESVADLMDFLIPVSSKGIPCPDVSVKVDAGFIDLYTENDASHNRSKYSAREQVLAEIKKLVDHHAVKNGEEVSISVVGHSLGSALATLSAYDIAETGVNGGKPVCVFSFAGPRVGNREFKKRFDKWDVKALRVVNVHDRVPKLPGIFINENVPEVLQWITDGLPWSYCHVGVELELDHKNSPFLKETKDTLYYHDLQAYLHLVDGYHGKGQKFELATGRDTALVNMGCDFLKDDLLIPPHWKQDLNKGLVKKDGKWAQPKRHHHLTNLDFNMDN